MLMENIFRKNGGTGMGDATIRFLRFFAIAAILASVVVQGLYPQLNLFADLGLSAAAGLALAMVAKILHVV